MLELALLTAVAVACLLMAALLMWRSGTEKKRQATAMQRLTSALARVEPGAQAVSLAVPDAWYERVLEDRLRRAGLVPGRRVYLLLVLPGLALTLGAAFVLGAKGAALALFVAYPLGLFLVLQWLTERFHNRVAAQLPDFIDSVMRIVSIGCSLELAFRNATQECRAPLRGIFSQVLLRTQAGVALEDSMMQVADAYGIKDLQFMAAVFYLGMRYGGNANAVLERVATSLRERERGQKELRAMTGETRASAWILSALPVFVGFMILIINPEYLRGMWLDPAGQKMLIAAAGLQVTGMFLLFRMAKI